MREAPARTGGATRPGVKRGRAQATGVQGT
ncbi:hypothetical protein DM49_2829 [Burkholderia mallei]|nr:hypothetical protein DM49_2829 [Burkholderia mallei]